MPEAQLLLSMTGAYTSGVDGLSRREKDEGAIRFHDLSKIAVERGLPQLVEEAKHQALRRLEERKAANAQSAAGKAAVQP